MQNPALAAQRGALGLYGQGIPNQGGQQSNPGMAGFGSAEGQQGQEQGQGQGGGQNQQGGYDNQAQVKQEGSGSYGYNQNGMGPPQQGAV